MSSLKIGTKIILVTVPITLLAVLLTAFIAGYSSRNALSDAAFERLTAVRELKAQQIEGYFDLVRDQTATAALDSSVISSLASLGFSVFSLADVAATTLDSNKLAVSEYYLSKIGPRLKESRLAGVDDDLVASLIPDDSITLLLQSYFLASDGQSQTGNSNNHWLRQFLSNTKKLDLILKGFAETFGFQAVYLVTAENERVVFSTRRGVELGTSLESGPLSQTNLAAGAIEAAKAELGQVVFSDFEKFLPANGSPTAFMASPVFRQDTRIGTVIFEISVDRINGIMTSNESWQDVGLGTSGETYLVGEDMLLRNQSRFLIEDRKNYLEMIKKIGTPEETARQIAAQTNSIGLQTVDTVGTRAALAGETDTSVFPDYRGVDVLSSFRPLNIPGVNWVIMSEIDKSEALADFERLRDSLILLTSIVLAGAIYIAYIFALSLTRPIRSLAATAGNISSGNLDAGVEVSAGDEIGELANDLEKMRLALKETFETVEEQNTQLESEVAARTNQLEETSSQLNSALSSMPNGIHMLDADLRYVLFNDQYLDHLGMPKEMIKVGTDVATVLKHHARKGELGEGEPDELVAQSIEGFRSRSSRRIERVLEDGRTIDIRFSYLSEGGVIVVTSDISELKEKERDLLVQNEEMKLVQNELKGSEQRTAKVVQSSPDGIITIDSKGAIQTFSASAERIFGYFSDEVVGRNIKMLMPKEIALEHDYYLERYVPGKPSKIVGDVRVVDAVRKDGSVFKMELRVEAVEFDDGEVIYIGTTRDITLRLQMEAEVNKAREDAIAANAAKSAFLANMSHELRTPMNAIIGYSEMLAEDAEDDGLDEMLSDLNKITSAGKHLLSLINDVLDLSKIEAGKMELFIEPYDFTEIATEVANTAQSLVEKNGNTLNVEIDDTLGTLEGDLTKTRQMLFNLISNSAKFTHGGTISLIGQAFARNDADWVRFTVADTGIGIPADKLEDIFQEFSQADESTTRNYGGTGLGLSLTRRFAQMMGGDIRVESTEGAGSSFIIEMPQTVVKKHEGLEAEASMTSSGETPEETGENGVDLKDAVFALGKESPLILVVDDEATARDLLTRALEQQGCRVQCARDGNEGLKLAAELKPDLITLDIMMPGMDGWTVLRKLKADKALRDMPVLMVSMIGDRGMSYELGAVDAIQKPVDRAKLRMFVDRYAKSETKNALIVEDDESARSNIKSFLKKDGWTVAEAENGSVGLNAAGTKAFDLILLDLMMPVMDGFEFLHNLRASDLPSAHSPVVVVTAKDLNAQDRARLSGSVDDVVSKSGRSVEQIVEEVKTSLNRRGTSDGGGAG